mgnify:CR=1 FL=1
MDSLNFSFWSDSSTPYTVLFKGKQYTGYWSLCAAIMRAVEENIPIIDPSFYANIDEKTFKYIFRSETQEEIPLLQERIEILRANGKVLIEVSIFFFFFIFSKKSK